MGLIFKDQEFSSDPIPQPPIVHRIAKNSETGEDYVLGFIVGRGFLIADGAYEFDKIDGQPPMTAAHKAFGTLWYGSIKPNLILSSEDYMKRMVAYMTEDRRKPVMYGCNFGFMLNGATWSYNDAVDCSDGWVFVLNTNYPTSPSLNACYRALQF